MLFIMLTETWLLEHLDAEIHIEGYQLFRADRKREKKKKGRYSGGAALYINNKISSSPEVLLRFSNSVVEVLCVHLKCHNIVLCVMYRQPSDIKGGYPSTAKELRPALKELDEVLQSLPSPTPDIIFGGDFNLPHMKWPEGTYGEKATPDEREMIDMLTELAVDHSLTQYITEATHRLGNTLDLVYTNNPLMIHSKTVYPSVCSPHYIVECKTTFATKQESSVPQIINDSDFDKLNFYSEDVNWENINSEFAKIDWKREFKGMTIESMTKRFIELTLQVIQGNVPARKKASAKGKQTIPKHRRKLLKRRTKLQKKLSKKQKRSLVKKIHIELREIEKKLQESYRTQKKYEESRAVDAIKVNSKYFFDYAKKRAKVRTTVGPLKDNDGKMTNDPRKMAELFSAQFKRVFSTPAQFPMNQKDDDRPTLETIYFDEQDIIEAINEVSQSAAAGPDRYPAIILKKCKEELSKPLVMIWRKSLASTDIAQVMRWSLIIPVHKSGNRDQAEMYRPIALTSHLIKIFEKVIRKSVTKFLEEYSLYNENQHGFRAGHSCLSQLLGHYDKILRLMEEGYNVDVIYLDFAKAFDKLDLNIALQKLFNLGIRGKVLAWIECFLKGRKQQVVVNGAKSEPVDVVSGVPQGSILGPLIFIVDLGDIDVDLVVTSVSSFADDSRAIGKVKTESDILAIQEDLDRIYQWAEANNMLFNSTKFECMRYGANEHIKNTTSYLSDTSKVIERKTSVRDLGVTMTDDATFKLHITEAVKSATEKCGWIHRTFQTRDPEAMLTLWKSLVQWRLDYCSQLWSPASLNLTQELEMVQRAFVKKMNGMSSLSYWEQLQKLGLYSQERRRDRYMAIYIWRILELQVPDFTQQNQITENCSPINSRNGRLCRIPHVKSTATCKVKTLLHASLAINGCQIFNSLPKYIRNLTGCTTEQFKKHLDEVLEKIPDEPKIPGYVAESNRILDYDKLMENTAQQKSLCLSGHPSED